MPSTAQTPPPYHPTPFLFLFLLLPLSPSFSATSFRHCPPHTAAPNPAAPPPPPTRNPPSLPLLITLNPIPITPVSTAPSAATAPPYPSTAPDAAAATTQPLSYPVLLLTPTRFR
nr:classical arabinogalactan protein 9-like [Arachis hypogaea]